MLAEAPQHTPCCKSLLSMHCVLCLQLIRDAEMLTASEVALLPVTLVQLYKQRSARERQAIVTHAFFEILTKPWALEPSKLSIQASLHSQRGQWCRSAVLCRAVCGCLQLVSG